MYNSNRWDQLDTIKIYDPNDMTCYNGCRGVRDEDFNYYLSGGPAIYRDKWAFFTNNRLDCIDSTDDFAYDASGRRIRKNDTHYTYQNGKLFKETREEGKTLTYLYGASGIIGFMDENRDKYFYQKNLQGDVIGLIGYDQYYGWRYVAYYVYDAFGNHKVYDADWNENTNPNFIGNINPIRYRSYYYDVETGFYYLETRYYDPEIGRFISPDNTKYLEPSILGGLNLYSYCINNPINFVDSNGCYVQKISSTYTSWLSINDFKNKDGTYSLYDNTRDGQKHKYHEQIFVVDPLSASVDVASGFCIGGSFTIFTGGWEGKNNDLSLFDFGRLTLQATWEPGYKSFEFGLSIWSPSYTFKTESGGSLTLGLNLGLIFGGTKSLGKQTIHLGIFSISWSP